MKYIKVWLALMLIFVLVTAAGMVSVYFGSLAKDFVTDCLGKTCGFIAYIVVLLSVMAVPITIGVVKIMNS